MKSFNTLSSIKYIIVHGGKSSHADEQRACALAYAFGADCDIFRRDPTPGELEDRDVLVLDVGMVCDFEKRNLDHHQRGRDEAPMCAYALLARYLECESDMSACFDWFEPGILMDVTGPFQTSKHYGVDWNTVGPMIATPEQDYFAHRWAEDIKFREEYSTHLGDEVRKVLEGWSKVTDYIHPVEIAGIKVGDCREQPDDLRCLQDPYIRNYGPEVMVFNDDRGNGLGLLRINDCPKIDFSKLEGRSDILFAHKGGFIAKTKTKDADLASRLSKAKV